VPGDMLNGQYIDELVKKAAEFGGGKIHIIVNNAGFTWDGVIHKMTDKQWDTIIALHNTAPFKLVRAAASYFRVKDGEPRCIINISSTSGVNGNAYVLGRWSHNLLQTMLMLEMIGVKPIMEWQKQV
jgi:3-oxoacyl-[acyl-carrier protein] reductase